MSKRKIIAIVAGAVVVAACILAAVLYFALGDKNTLGDIDLEAGESGLYIDGDKVSYGMKETFEESYYDKDELRSLIDAEVAEFNSEHDVSGDVMSLSAYKVKNMEAYVVFEFASYEDFVSYMTEYNRVSEENIFLGTVDEAAAKFSIDADFVSVKGSGAVSASDILENGNYNILIINEQMKVQISGGAESMSDNCTVESGIITTPADETGYIIFK